LSHLIFQVSSNLGEDGIFNMSPSTFDFSTDWNATSNGNSNPGMPNSIYGFKVDGAAGVFTFSFDTYRLPMWGNFYAKDGVDKEGDTEINVTAWNKGLETGADPGQYPIQYIAVPDTVVPIPPTALLLGSGLLGLGVLGWRRKRS
jgi:hypothetical protein